MTDGDTLTNDLNCALLGLEETIIKLRRALLQNPSPERGAYLSAMMYEFHLRAEGVSSLTE